MLGDAIASRNGGQNMQNSEFAYFSSKSGKHMKHMPRPPFWRGVGVKKSGLCFLDWGAQSPLLAFSGARKSDFERPNPKTETTFSRQHLKSIFLQNRGQVRKMP